MAANGNKVVVVTGASSGVGFETALGLARDGYRVIALGRNPERMVASAEAVAKAAPGARVDWLGADLSVMAEVREVSRRIGDLADRIDVLINNAGQTINTYNVTVEGLEQTFAGNVLAPFLMTGILLPLLHNAPQPHVITTASVGHSYIDDMFWDDLQFQRGYSCPMAYLQSKLANILFTRELAVRHAELVSSSIHPGTVSSNFTDTADERTKQFFAEASKKGELVTPADAADTLLWLTRDIGNALPSGGYFSERERIEPSAAAMNPDSAKRLWAICEDLAGIAY